MPAYDRFVNTDRKAISFNIGQEILLEMEKVIRDSRVTPFQFTIATFALLIYSIKERKDMFITFPNTNRVDKDFENVVGWLLGSTYLQTNINESISFEHFLSLIEREIDLALKYSFYPIDYALEGTNIHSKYDISSLFLNFHYSSSQKIADFTGFKHYKNYRNGLFDLNCFVDYCSTSMNVSCTYCTEYSSDEMEYYFQFYIKMLEKLINNPNLRLRQILANE